MIIFNLQLEQLNLNTDRYYYPYDNSEHFVSFYRILLRCLRALFWYKITSPTNHQCIDSNDAIPNNIVDIKHIAIIIYDTISNTNAIIQHL